MISNRMDSQVSKHSKRLFEERRAEVRLHLSHFLVGYLNEIYKAFDGDIAMAIVLGEISHHNTAPFFSPDKQFNAPVRVLEEDPEAWKTMTGCNAYSISCATGIPRETVRRKIATMLKRGWLVNIPKQGLRITEACAEHFGPHHTMGILDAMLRTSATIQGLLDDSTDNQAAEQAAPVLPSRRTPAPAKTKVRTSPKPTSKKPS